MKTVLRVSILLLLSCVFVSCNEHRVTYHKYNSISDSGWSKTDTLTYQIPPTDSMKEVKLFAEIRNTLKYPYADFYLVIRQNMADSLSWQTDTIHMQLADSLGKWKGKGWGNYYQNECYVKNIKLPPHPFQATIRASQGMKDNKLKGISDVGFRIEY